MIKGMQRAIRSKRRMEEYLLSPRQTPLAALDLHSLLDTIAEQGHTAAYKHALTLMNALDVQPDPEEVSRLWIKTHAREFNPKDCFASLSAHNSCYSADWETLSWLVEKGYTDSKDMSVFLEVCRKNQMPPRKVLLLHIMRKQYLPQDRVWCTEAASAILEGEEREEVVEDRFSLLQWQRFAQVFARKGEINLCERIMHVSSQALGTQDSNILFSLWTARLHQHKNNGRDQFYILCPSDSRINLPSPLGEYVRSPASTPVLAELASYGLLLGMEKVMEEVSDPHPFLSGIHWKCVERSQAYHRAMGSLAQHVQSYSSEQLEDFLHGVGRVIACKHDKRGMRHDFVNLSLRNALSSCVSSTPTVVVDPFLEESLVQGDATHGLLDKSLDTLELLQGRSGLWNRASASHLFCKWNLGEKTQNRGTLGRIEILARQWAKEVDTSRDVSMASSLQQLFAMDQFLDGKESRRMMEGAGRYSYPPRISLLVKMRDWQGLESAFETFEQDLQLESQRFKILSMFLDGFCASGNWKRCWQVYERASEYSWQKLGVCSELLQSLMRFFLLRGQYKLALQCIRESSLRRRAMLLEVLKGHSFKDADVSEEEGVALGVLQTLKDEAESSTLPSKSGSIPFNYISEHVTEILNKSALQ